MLTMVKMFVERSNNYVTYAVFNCIAHPVKKSAFAERNIRSLNKIPHRYIEEKWTNSHIDQVDNLLGAINLRVNPVTKHEPNKIRKKDVPILGTGDFVRIVRKDKAFRINYKQSFTDEVYDINVITTFSPPAYYVEDADNETIKGTKILSTKIKDSLSCS